jgi:hypothetical protein
MVAPDRARTCNLRLRRSLLYPLSYGSVYFSSFYKTLMQSVKQSARNFVTSVGCADVFN